MDLDNEQVDRESFDVIIDNHLLLDFVLFLLSRGSCASCLQRLFCLQCLHFRHLSIHIFTFSPIESQVIAQNDISSNLDNAT